jgi:L-galactose dehydrogenase
VEYRELGTTGLRVSALGYGASPLGGVFGVVDEGEGIRAVRTALELGVNFIDVSPFYGATTAETVLGKALRGVDRASYVLATKVGRYGDAVFDFSAQRVVRSVDESLSRLGCDYIDLIQCHDIEFGDLDQIVTEAIPALERLRETGKVRLVGVSGYPLEALTYVAERARLDTVLSYGRYTLLDRGLLRWTPRFVSRGIGVINAAPLAMGLLTEGGPPAWHPAHARLRQHARRAARLCRRRGVDIARLALQFGVAAPHVATTVVGAADPDIVARTVRWAAEAVDQALLSEVEALLGPVLDTGWRTGRPENSDSTILRA